MIVAIVVQEGNNNKEQRAGAFLLVKGSFGLTTREPIFTFTTRCTTSVLVVQKSRAGSILIGFDLFLIHSLVNESLPCCGYTLKAMLTARYVLVQLQSFSCACFTHLCSKYVVTFLHFASFSTSHKKIHCQIHRQNLWVRVEAIFRNANTLGGHPPPRSRRQRGQQGTQQQTMQATKNQ